MSKLARMGQGLYEGRVSIDFVGRRNLWYAISGVLLAVCVFALFKPGLTMGIEFEGGQEYRVPISEPSQDLVDDLTDTVRDTGIEAAAQPIVNISGDDAIRVQTKPLTEEEGDQILDAIAGLTAVDPDEVSINAIGPSWGESVAKRALTGLVVFLILVVILIAAYTREWKMSVAAIVALIHDILITIGVYALSGFEVTPATVTGLLTILGFSLYDTVVVFDKVRENTKNLSRSRQTYAEAANLAVNQTLVRSINTAIVALLPVGAILYVGTVQLGSGALKDLALALFVGMAAGTYSSIFIATPLLVQLKEMEPGVRAGDARARKHRSRRAVDPFAQVPVYTDGMEVADSPAELTALAEDDDDDEPRPAGNRPVPSGDPGRFTAGERPGTARPVADSGSAGRPQPKRKPRSQRGKP